MQIAHSETTTSGTTTMVDSDEFHHGMMGYGVGGGSIFVTTAWIFWLLLIVLLIGLIRWVWQQGDKK